MQMQHKTVFFFNSYSFIVGNLICGTQGVGGLGSRGGGGGLRESGGGGGGGGLRESGGGA